MSCSASGLLSTRSVLVTMAIFGRLLDRRQLLGDETVAGAELLVRRAGRSRSRRPRPRWSRTTSLSRSPSRVRGLCRPGVSTRISWASGRCTMPRTVCRVVCGRFEVIATFCPTRAFVRVDLPALGRPTKQAKPARCGVPGRRGRASPAGSARRRRSARGPDPAPWSRVPRRARGHPWRPLRGAVARPARTSGVPADMSRTAAQVGLGRASASVTSAAASSDAAPLHAAIATAACTAVRVSDGRLTSDARCRCGRSRRVRPRPRRRAVARPGGAGEHDELVVLGIQRRFSHSRRLREPVEHDPRIGRRRLAGPARPLEPCRAARRRAVGGAADRARGPTARRASSVRRRARPPEASARPPYRRRPVPAPA